MENQKANRFKDLEKIIQLQQKDVMNKLEELKQLMSKKMMSIEAVERYFTEYQASFNRAGAISMANFQNFQAFLNQIAKVLHQERDALAELGVKKELLLKEYLMNENRIEAMQKMLDR